MSVPSLLPLLDSRRVVLCVGCGGVGKTTVAAALGLGAARRGRRALCLTIDPARRLANALGFDRMTSDAQAVGPSVLRAVGVPPSGKLTVMMLDTKRTFDDLVRLYASSPEARDRILGNVIYQYVSSTLAGTQEYMAMEKLLAVKNDEQYDVIILDTPPTSNALDFLDAPERMVRAIDSAATRWFLEAFAQSRKFSLNLVAKSVAIVLRGIGNLTGGGFLEQVAEFITDLNDLFGGFRERALEVARAFRGSEFAYVLVTTPSPVTIKEAEFFADRLREQGMRHDALVVNQVHRRPRLEVSRDQVRAALRAHDLDMGGGAEARFVRALEEERRLSDLDAAHLEEADARGAPRVDIPALPGDVSDVGTLSAIATLLCAED